MGGKGGVGKTTCAAAFALLHADRSRRTLVVSTDPAPSLGDALNQRLAATPRAVSGTAGLLHAAEIDARSAMSRWLRRRRPILQTIALRGSWLDEDDVAELLRQTLPGLDELAALFEILSFARSGRYDILLLDTAPTGHTLRLLELPDALSGAARTFDHMQARHRAIVSALRGHWPGDEADALIAELEDDARDMRALLRDRERTEVSWVTLPEALSVAETEDALRALRRFSIGVQRVVVNRVTLPPPGACEWCSRRRAEEYRAIRALANLLKKSFGETSGPALGHVAAQEEEPTGLAALRRVAALLARAPERPVGPRLAAGSRRLLLAHADSGEPCTEPSGAGTRLMLLGGKGGVGKTTCAAAVALEAACRSPSKRILLLSSDPAHSLADVLSVALSDVPQRIPGGPPNLEARELDASAALRKLRQEFAAAIDRLFSGLDGGSMNLAYDRRVLDDLVELAPPGLDEIAAILNVLALTSGRDPAGYDLIVIDTAPTGHALRLLEMPRLLQRWVHAFMRIVLKYQPVVGAGALGRSLLELSRGLTELRRTLSDPHLTRFVVVTRAARLPRAETMRLSARLARLRIPVSAVIVNAAGAGSCRRCRRAARREERDVAALRRAMPGSLVSLAPATVPPPVGQRTLRRWRREWRCRKPGADPHAACGTRYHRALR